MSTTLAVPNDKETRVAPVLQRGLFINNEWRAGSTGETFSLVNPATETSFGSAASATSEDVHAAVVAARAAFDTGPWPQLSIKERAVFLLRLADEIESAIDPLTELVMMETGLPRADSKGGTLAMLSVLRYYASIADSVELIETRKGRTGVSASIEKVPIGVVAQIVPWNSPIVMAAFNLPAALLAGCSVILKPSELTPLSAGYLADAALRAGLPPGVFTVVTGAREASDALVRHPGVNKIAFTGSTPTGRKIAEAAAPTLKHVALELGGKAAALIRRRPIATNRRHDGACNHLQQWPNVPSTWPPRCSGEPKERDCRCAGQGVCKGLGRRSFRSKDQSRSTRQPQAI